MVGPFRAVAADFDGTLTSTGRRPGVDVLAALERTRAAGLRVVLVTGRILRELRADFPDVDSHVDAIVAENGAVVSLAGRHEQLAPPVDPDLAAALRRRGVPVRRGEVLLACDGHDARTALDQIRNLGLDCQLVHNKGALMILPAGVTKGTGLLHVLGDLGISHHSTIGVGDAENDHALLDVCEVGAAVAGSVPALRRHADLLVDQPDGAGVRALLEGPVLSGSRPIHSRRWQLRLGTAPDGAPVAIPASQVSVLVCGDSGSGKSYLAGLIAERLITLDYCAVVVDPLGDHRELGRLRGAITLDARDGLPDPARVTGFLRRRFYTVVLDLSALPAPDRQDYLDRLGPELERQRADVGLPHWLILDEAQDAPPTLLPPGDGAWPAGRDRCLVTYRVGDLPPQVRAGLDVVVAMAAGGPLADDVVAAAHQVSGLREQEIRHLAGRLRRQEALVARRPTLGPTTPVRLAVRTTPQVRHEHKYASVPLAPEHWFYFRSVGGSVVDAAPTLADLRRSLAAVGDSVLRHHATAGDLSRWVAEVFSDQVLATVLADAERQLAAGRLTAAEARAWMTAAVSTRYPP